MKINDSKPTPKTIRLGSLNFGEVFKHDGFHFMVVHPVDGCFALNLSDGSHLNLSVDTQVLPLPNAKLHTNE